MKKSILVICMLAALGGCGGDNGKSITPADDHGGKGSNARYQELNNKYFYALKDKTDNPTASPLVMDIGEVPGTAVATNNPLTVERPSADETAAMQEVIRRVNALRAEQGREPVAWDDSLTAYAEVRAQELKQGFSHKRPDGSSDQDPRYVTRGYVYPNIGSNYETPEEVVEGWKNSPGHYVNIMNPEHRKVGVGYHHDPSTYSSGDSKEGYLDVANWVLVLGDGNTQSIYNLTAASPEISVDGVRQKLGGITVSGARGKVIPLANGYQLSFRGYSDSQAYGQIEKGGTPLAYVNIGQPYLPKETDRFSATYKGKSIGDWAGVPTTADVTARVDFQVNNKSMALTLDNTMLNGQPHKALDFSDTLHWNTAHHRFEAAKDNYARFYGPYASEVGGQFKHDVENKNYQGAYGAVIQP